jgi:hypothetical protein
LRKCPKACTSDLNLQCENNYSFKFNVGDWRGDKIDVGCDWFYENKTVKRREMKCDEYNEILVQNCRRACNACKCKDSGYRFKVWGRYDYKIEVGCEWLYGPNSARRKTKWCKKDQILRNCRLACDIC